MAGTFSSAYMRRPYGTRRALLSTVAPIPSPAVGTYAIPSNVVGGEAGKGYTITGLARAADGTWWTGNDGRKNGETALNVPSVVHLSADFSTVLSETTALQMGLAAGIYSVQGVSMYGDKIIAMLKAPGTGASLAEKVFVLSADGSVDSSFTFAANTNEYNGLAYDSSRNLFVTNSGASVSWRTIAAGLAASSTPTKTITIANQDQLHYRSATDDIFTTGGTNGQNGSIRRYNASTLAFVSSEAFVGSTAIEGCVVFDDKIAVANDGWYHNGVGINSVTVYALPASFA